MALTSTIYPLAKQSWLTQSPSINVNSTLKCGIGRAADGYTYSAAHQYYSDVEASMVSAYASTVIVPGILVVFQRVVGTTTPHIQFPVSTGAAVDFMILFADGGTSATSPLIALITLAAPVTPSSGHVVQVDWAAGGIFSI